MRIGITIGAAASNRLQAVVARARELEALGFSQLWMVQAMGLDAITALSVAGSHTSAIGLGTSVVPTSPRHPVVMAQQALTAAAASGGRFTLGIGTSHRLLIEDMFGLPFTQPARHMREYLEVLNPLLNGERVKFRGEHFQVNSSVSVENASDGPVPVLLGALGPQMLRLAGCLTAGTVTWLAGMDTLENHVVPTITQAASEVGGKVPRVVAGLPILLTDDADGARAKLTEKLAFYDAMPSYRAMLDREGVSTAADVAILGDDSVLDAALARLRDIGVTDLRASINAPDAASERRTVEYLASKI